MGVQTEWHSHVLLVETSSRVKGMRSPTAQTIAVKTRGGITAPNQIAMVHAWTVPNPDGPYAHDNPALPFIATGLKPPVHATHDDRLLGLALGETYGAKLPIAHRIELVAGKDKAQSLDGHRAKLRVLVVQPLRAAEIPSDASKEQALRRCRDRFKVAPRPGRRSIVLRRARSSSRGSIVRKSIRPRPGAMAHHQR